MKDKISHGGNVVTIAEYEVRDIDEFGDAQNVDHYPSKALALLAARQSIAAGSKAVAVELHVSKRPAFLFKNPNKYTMVAVMGDIAALEAWGWKHDCEVLPC